MSGVTGGGGVRLDGLSGGVQGTRVEAAQHGKHHHDQEDSAMLLGRGHIDVSQASNSFFYSGKFLVLFCPCGVSFLTDHYLYVQLLSSASSPPGVR